MTDNTFRLLAKTLAQVMFNDENAMVRIDASEVIDTYRHHARCANTPHSTAKSTLWPVLSVHPRM